MTLIEQIEALDAVRREMMARRIALIKEARKEFIGLKEAIHAVDNENWGQ